jgi:hypothetical protein
MEPFWILVLKISAEILDHNQSETSYLVMSYVNDFATVPFLGRPASLEDCRRASRRLCALLLRKSLTRNTSNEAVAPGACSI